MPELLLFGLMLVVLVGIAIATVLRPGFDEDLATALDRLVETILRRASVRQPAAETNGLAPPSDEIRRRLGLGPETPVVAPPRVGVTVAPAAPPAMRAGDATLIAAAAAPAPDVEPGEPVPTEPVPTELAEGGERALAAAQVAAVESAALGQPVPAPETGSVAPGAPAHAAVVPAPAPEVPAFPAEAPAPEPPAPEPPAPEPPAPEPPAPEPPAPEPPAMAEPAAATVAALLPTASTPIASSQPPLAQSFVATGADTPFPSDTPPALPDAAPARDLGASAEAPSSSAANEPPAPRPDPDAPAPAATVAAGLIGQVAEAGRTIARRLFGGEERAEARLASNRSAASAGSRATPDQELEETRPAAAYRQILRGNRSTLESVAASLAAGDPAVAARWQLLLDRLFSSIEALALEAGYLDPPRAQPFWATFGPDQGRDVMKALGSLGYRFDGRGGWLDDRPPTRRDLSIAVGYAGVDPVRMRTWPSPEELGALAGQVTIAGAEYLEVVAPGLTLAEVSAAVEPLDAAGALGEVWREWDRVRPLLLAEG